MIDVSVKDAEYNKFLRDLDNKVVVRTVAGKSLKDLFDLINSSGFLDGETYDGFLAEETQVTSFIIFRFFFEGEEQFQVSLGFNSEKNIGGYKSLPTADITKLSFVQNLNLGLEPIGSLMGIVFATGGSNIVFTLLTDADGIFELQNNNQLVSTIPIPEGTYKIFVKAAGTGNTQYIDEITIIVLATALISNINLSNLTVEDTAPISTVVGALSTNGGEAPISYTLTAQATSSGTPVDIFEMSGTSLVTKAAVGAIGSTYRVFITAEDSRADLVDDQRLKLEEFDIAVVGSTFVNTNSLDFDGIDERVDIPADISLWGNQNFSGSFWIKPDNIGASQYFASKFREAGKRSWAIRVNTNGTIAIVYSQTGVASDTTTTPTPVIFGAWSHVAFAFDGTLGTPKMKIWINGVLDVDEDTTLTGLYNNIDVEMFFGALNQPLPTVASNYFRGNLDEFTLYNISLSSSQVTELYNSGSPTNVAGLTSGAGIISWWRMGDDFSGGVQPDSYGSNDGTGVNMKNSNKSTDVV